MSNNLHAASSQWAARPADERFWSVSDMRMACERAKNASTTAIVPFEDLRTRVLDGEVYLTTQTSLAAGRTSGARLTHYAFGQLAGAASAPGAYLRTLPPALASEAINASLVRRAATSEAIGPRSLLMHKNGGQTVRALVSDKYDRVWDAEVCAHLEALVTAGWRAPAGRTPPGYDGPQRAATANDILPGQINISVGTPIAPSGLYASDHDMFAFLVAPDRVIDDGSGHPLMRGVFVKNSEVGDAALSMTFFLMQAVCGNHIVWNATGVHEISLRHVGKDTWGRAARQFEAVLRRYHDAGSSGEELQIAAARKLVLGNSKAEVLEALIKYAKGHSIPLSKPTFERALTVAEEHVDWYGNPRTLWASVAGLTHASQGTTFADDRAEIDRAAGKLLAMASTV